jgi:hypothetical protein
MTTRIEARRAEIARRYRRKRCNRPVSMAALRIAELRRLFKARYRDVLPDDDAGRDEALVMAHHLAHRAGDPRRRITGWLELQAPWMTPAEIAALISTVLAKPLRWRADKLAARLNLTEAERRRLRITTIGAVDRTKAERIADRKRRKRLIERARRRARGVRPRAEYQRSSVSRAKPWLALGISRRTWYRQRAFSESGTSPWTA